jgi:hypothetical protein
MAIEYGVEIRIVARRQSMDTKSLIIGGLLIAVGVLSYLLYDANQTKVKIDLPGVKIEGR